jgi:hypothetical protein
MAMRIHQYPALAGLLASRNAFDGRYSNVENRFASLPDRRWSRIKTRSKYSRRIVPINRSTKGWESGM